MAKTKIRKERALTVCFTVSEKEKELLIQWAKYRDMSLSDYCRNRLFSGLQTQEKEG